MLNTGFPSVHQSPRPPPLSLPAQRVTWERGADMTKTSVDQSALSPHARGGHLHSRSGRRTCTCPRQPSFFCRCSTPSPSLTLGTLDPPSRPSLSVLDQFLVLHRRLREPLVSPQALRRIFGKKNSGIVDDGAMLWCCPYHWQFRTETSPEDIRN